MKKADRLVRACRDDTSILTSLIGWLDEEREKVLERLSRDEITPEIYRHQGEARKLRELRTLLGEMCRVKDA